jgi:hypothetical protein
MVYYDSASKYIDCASDLRDKITRIETIISALEDTALKAAANDNITEYSLNGRVMRLVDSKNFTGRRNGR